MKKDFQLFMSQLIETNRSLDFYCDFPKIKENVDKISLKLHQLNYLLGKENMHEAIEQLWNENPKVFEPQVLQILIAVRSEYDSVIAAQDGSSIKLHEFSSSPERVKEYFDKTGLTKVFQDKNITNVVDYVFGIETGLDTNARKNRSGKIMANKIANILKRNNIIFDTEEPSTKFKELSVLGKDKKTFDFVIKTKITTYLIEVNFFSGGGSKLNETARSFSEIASKIQKIPDFEFVWITDGGGWQAASNNWKRLSIQFPLSTILKASMNL